MAVPVYLHCAAVAGGFDSVFHAVRLVSPLHTRTRTHPAVPPPSLAPPQQGNSGQCRLVSGSQYQVSGRRPTCTFFRAW